MKGRFVLLVVLALLGSTAAVSGEETTVETFGEALSTGLELTPIGVIMADPDAWEGKRVRIAGRVSGVCAHRGCWIDLRDEEDATLRVKVDDGVIVFPQDAVGQLAEAEGEVEILPMDRERYTAWLRHVAEEEGREFDPATIGEGPHRIVRLRGIGAEIARP